MRIDSLALQNFCGFEYIKLDFDPFFNLLVGVNGSGKTSILKGVRAILQYLGPEDATTNAQTVIQDSEHREVIEQIKGRYRALKHMPMISAIVRHSDTEPPSEYNLNPQSCPGEVVTTVSRTMDSRSYQSLMLFYQSRRNSNGTTSVTQESAVQSKLSRYDAYRNWSNAADDMVNLGNWIVALTLQRLQNFVDEKVSSESDELDLLNQAVSHCLEGSTGLKYDISSRSLLVEWKDFPPTRFDQLSDGQHSICVLVADIARRACILNPQLGADVLRKTPGVVLIDELDLHLHPAWQRKFPTALKSVFPQIQFICTSHSPQIIGELKASEIRLIKDGTAIQPTVAYGLDSNRILDLVMDAESRTPDIQELLDRLFASLECEQVNRSRELIQQLSQKMGSVYEVPELVEAQAMIEEIERDNAADRE